MVHFCNGRWNTVGYALRQKSISEQIPKQHLERDRAHSGSSITMLSTCLMCFKIMKSFRIMKF